MDAFNKEVLGESRPVLVLCMHRDSEFQEQTDVVEGVCRTYGEKLKAFLMDEEFIGAFRENFEVKGTPTFMIFIGGAEKGRMLGQTDQKALEDFVSRTLSLDQEGK
ncbi:MAG: thioredoxin family protein [Deltaproteobacteria bacterium]|nr:thioredoxin family protein [Deltaproteobacteria bacterium]